MVRVSKRLAMQGQFPQRGALTQFSKLEEHSCRNYRVVSFMAYLFVPGAAQSLQGALEELEDGRAGCT